MDQAELLLSVRAVLKERAEGFWDTQDDFFKYADRCREEIYNTLLKMQDDLKILDEFFEFEALKPLIASKTFDIVSATSVYTFSGMTVTDFKKAYNMMVATFTGVLYGATELNTAEQKFRELNDMEQANIKNPTFSVNTKSQLTIKPTPTSAVTGGCIFEYYKTLTAFDGTSALQMDENTHNAILYKMLQYAYAQDDKEKESIRYENMVKAELRNVT